MRLVTSLKIMIIASLLFLASNNSWGQATLPVNATFALTINGSPGTMPTGFSQSGLSGYAGALKFDTAGDWLQLYFDVPPGTLTFDLGVNGTFPGTISSAMTFTIQESSNGITWSTSSVYTNVVGGTKTISNLNTESRYIRWYYTTKPSGSNIALKNVTLAVGNTSIINTSSASLSGFTYVNGSGPSSNQSFTVSGINMADNITLTPPSDYEISTLAGSSFVALNSVILQQTDGVITSTPIYVRLKSGLAVANYNENIVLTSTGANTKAVACSGTVTTLPTIKLTDLTDPTLNTVAGVPVSQTINVSGVNLNVDLGLSITGPDAGLFSLSQSAVTQTEGAVPNTIVTITYSPISVGSNTATLVMASAGAMPVTRTLNGNATIGPDTGISLQKSFIISALNGNVILTADAGETVEIYNSLGQKLIQKSTVNGINIIPVNAHGVILVKVGNKVAKVVL